MESNRKRGLPIGTPTLLSANRIRDRRTRLRMSLQEVSIELDGIGHTLGTPALSKLENGHRRIDVDDLTALARVLGTTVADLTGVSDLEPPAPGVAALGDIARQLRQLNAAVQELLRKES